MNHLISKIIYWIVTQIVYTLCSKFWQYQYQKVKHDQKNSQIVSGHRYTEMLVGTQRFGRFLTFAPAAASLLHRLHCLVATEIKVEYSCEFSAVKEVVDGGCFWSEEAGAEADAHVVVVHFIFFLSSDDF